MSIASNAKRILSPNAKKGDNRFMLEEVYFSDIVEEGVDENRTLDPWRAYKDASGYYHFLFPSLWYTSVCNNKAIGLRRIETRAKHKDLLFQFEFTRVLLPLETVAKTVIVQLHVVPQDDIDTILSQMCYYINNFITGELRKEVSPEYSFSIHYKYDSVDSSVVFYDMLATRDGSGNNLNWAGSTIDFTITPITSDLCEVLSVPRETSFQSYKKRQSASSFLGVTLASDYQLTYYKFTSVWNRKFCFVHASFVTGTSFQYLGRSGDFYPKPSKMYQFTGNSTDFTLAVSYDGRTPQYTNEIVFIVELAYIYTTGEYMGE